MILHDKQIKANIAYLKCGNSNGTAFLISSDKAITALHCIEEYNADTPIELNFKDTIYTGELKAIPINRKMSFDNNIDIVVLKLDNEILNQEYFKLSKELLSNQSLWKTFGYPNIESIDGMLLEGKILYEKRENNPEDYDLVVKSKETISNIEGLSGSPLIVEGKVYGVIIFDRNKRNTLGVISIKKSIQIFDALQIEIEEKKIEKVEAIINAQTEKKIFNYVENSSGGYLFLKGTPGSGKTTFVHNFKSDIDNIDILDKYFLKGIDEKYNVQYNSNKENLGKWILNNISKYLFSSLYNEKIESDSQLISKVVDYISQLSIKAKNINKKIIIFLDGIDEMLLISKEQIKDFFSIFPVNILENIFIIISGNSEELLPINIKLQTIINISPLNLDEVKVYIREKLNIKNKNLLLINKLAEKSEGNPLYLKYLIDEINISNEFTEQKIDLIASFNGSIECYYNLFWNRIYDEFSLVKILGLIARTRKGIQKEYLEKMLNMEERGTFEKNFSKLNHLINYRKGYLEIYHTSFENFIKNKTLNMDNDLHDIIATFCLNNKDSRYSLENKLYHLLNGKNDMKKQVLKSCSQEWLDACSIGNINLELMLEDIKNVLKYSMDFEKFSEIIRILLLIERLTFRNEKLFKIFSVKISRALFEIGKGNYILNYLLKDGQLQENISNEDSIYFLHKLFENNFYNEGNQLLKAIEKRCIETFENNEVTSDILFSSLIATIYKDSKLALKRLEYFNEILNEFSPKNAREIMEDITSAQLAFLMKKDNFYVNIETLKKTFGTKYSYESISFISKIILHYMFIEERNYIYKENKGVEIAINDLEFLLKEYPLQKNTNALVVLIIFSKNISLIQKLVSYENEPSFNIRSNNKVDFNFDDYLDFKNFWMFQGYSEISLNKKDELNWEEFLLIKIKEVNIILGNCFRKKAENKTESFNQIYKKMQLVLNSLDFTLDSRAEWDRSYHIPEHIFPQLYGEIAFIYSNFFESKLDDLKEFIFRNYQLGLYNEGYRRALFNISIEIIKNNSKKIEALDILNKLECFIDKYVLNRWERNGDFLKLVELYGQLGAKEKAELIFKKMLETSMGPTWYKEDQLTLMPIGIENLKNISQTKKFISEVLGNLDYASGEMTFQRYIRDDKEKMIGIIGEFINKDKALKYLKNKILPSYEEVLKNIDKDSFDVLKKSNGYIQGANEIDIQDSIYSFIKKQNDLDPYVEFALTQIFILGDERYFKDYVNLQIKILKNAKINDSSFYNKLIKRIKRQFIVELDELGRALFLKYIEKENDFLELVEELRKLNVPISTEKKALENEIIVSSDVKEIPIINFAKKEIAIGNIEAAKKGLENRLIEIYKKNGDVFFYSNESLECLNLLQTLCSSERELISYLKSVCINSYDLGWRTASRLIKMAGHYLEKEESNNTMEEILTHMKLVLRTPRIHIEEYKWVQEELVDNSYSIEKYIIWLMNLPSDLIYQKKSIEILIWLGTEKPLIIIPLLVEDSLKEKKLRSSEASASILYNLSKTSLVLLETIWYSIITNFDLKNKILEETHFMIKSYYYEISKLAKKVGLVDAEKYLFELETNLFNKTEIIIKKDIDWDLYSSKFDKNLIFFLKKIDNSIGINSEFMNKLIHKTEEFIHPIKIEQLYELDKIFERSYSLANGMANISRDDIKIVINLMLIGRVTFKNYNDLKRIVRSHNPYFPESKFSLEIPNIHFKLNKFIQERGILEESCLYNNNKLILHYDEIIYDNKKRKADRIEVVAFLIDDLKEIPNSNEKLYDIFYANEEPEDAKINKFNNIFPLVTKCSFTLCKNNWNTPSIIHPNFEKEYNIKNTDIDRLNWKSGTILDTEGFGLPIQEGKLLSIDKKYLNKIKKQYKLMYRVTYNLDEKLIFLDFKSKKILEVF